MSSKVHALGEKSMGWISVCPAHSLVLRVKGTTCEREGEGAVLYLLP